MSGLLLIAACLAAISSIVDAECANACNGHGKCTSYDMCICNRNWQASDCSERICMFGLAHVDTPKGDLDMSGAISGPSFPVIDNNFVYPYGTTEQFPQMEDSDLTVLENSAHYYMECSNKGKCDRTTGECQCYDGYDGVACQRASCPGFPNSCSGHGVCKTIKQLAAADSGNYYELWDRDSTMGCECDKGYSGADCSIRECKYGVDPLYLDDVATVKYSIFDFATLTTKQTYKNDDWFFTDGQIQAGHGKWSIRFYDNFGEDWVTDPIKAGASCGEVMNALYSLPNNVIASDSLYCTKVSIVNGTSNTFSFHNYTYDSEHLQGSSHPYKLIYQLNLWETETSLSQGELSLENPITHFTGSNDTTTSKISGYIYRVKFLNNPGKLRNPEIEIYLDGKRPSLVSPGGKVMTKVWTDGQQGEDDDYFADHCNGVSATIGHYSSSSYGRNSFLNGMTIAQKNILKKCLGSADFDTSNNVDVYNWDYGNEMYPHMIKLVRSVTTYTDGGYYAVLWYDTDVYWDQTNDNDGTFRLLNPFTPPDNYATDRYDIYTTTGVLGITSNHSTAAFGFGSKYIYMTNITYDLLGYNTTDTPYTFDGDISCDVSTHSLNKFKFINHCLNKTDMFTMLNWEHPEYNPQHINLYTAERVYKGPYEYSVHERFSNFRKKNKDYEMHYMTNMITADLSTNWASAVGDYGGQYANNKTNFHVYKFFPAVSSTYTYVAPCSNRGICDTDSGVCDCFSGYTSDSCSDQSSLAV